MMIHGFVAMLSSIRACGAPPAAPERVSMVETNMWYRTGRDTPLGDGDVYAEAKVDDARVGHFGRLDVCAIKKAT
jgi:hypothetical protein